MTYENNPSTNPADDAFLDPSDDPRLTAYALGELAGPEHAVTRASIEAQLAADPMARAFVEETRDLAVSLRDGYLAAPVVSLTDAQRAAVMARAAEPVPGVARNGSKGRVLRVANWSVPAAAAAAILVGVTFSYRHDIGRWWSGERVVAQGELNRNSELRYELNRAVADASGPGSNGPATKTYYSFNTSTFSYGSGGGSGGGHGSTPDVQGGRASSSPGKADAAAAPPSGPQPSPLLGDRAREAGGGGGHVDEQGWAGATVTRFKGGAGDPGGAKGGDPAKNAADDKVEVHFEYGVTAEGGAPLPAEREVKRAHNDIRLGDRPIVGTLLQLPADPQADETIRRLQGLGYVGTVTTSTWGDETANGVLAPAGSRFTVHFNHAVDFDVIRRLVADGKITAEQAEVLRRAVTPRETIAPGESYAAFADNPFRRAIDAPLSTFGVDVDTASYTNVRRFLSNGQLPPPQAVRIEEFVNYFEYRYAPPTDGSAFAAQVEVAGCPWDTSHRLVRVALKGRVEDMRERPPANLVFLIDVSGSMQPDNKLPLLIRSMKQLVPTLGERDKVSIVTYAGEAGVALPPTRGDQKETILAALDRLRAGGSTNGAAGIETAYRLAAEGFIPGGVNRVMLATDGDFNVGVSDDDALVRIISEKAKSKVFLSVLGFGEGNLQDKKMEGLADKGNGNYAYIDSLREGQKVLVDQAAATLIAIAKDVKLQIEFNPARVASYRLIGYENRTLAAADFADDAKDAGDLGSGHTVTALYEIAPTGTTGAPGAELRYQQQATTTTAAAHSDELCVVKLRWKLPEGDVSTYREIPVTDSGASYAKASADFKFAAAVASFGMLLRGSPHRAQSSFDATMELATDGLEFDPNGLRAEFIDLVRKAKALAGR